MAIADRVVREILLIGEPDTKRTCYFKKAARELGYGVKQVTLEDAKIEHIQNARWVKIDPPTYEETEITQIAQLMAWYEDKLNLLGRGIEHRFLNTPQAIVSTLDKVGCKEKLMMAGIPTTPMLSDSVGRYDQLITLMTHERIGGVFMKPRFGAGAAGVMAYRYHPRTKQQVLYTSMVLKGDKLYNTKQMQKLTEHKLIEPLINRSLKEPMILEKWVQKAGVNGLSYDLRVVYQYGKVDFMIARGSKGPITNLHLNNCVLDLDEIGMSEMQRAQIQDICEKTVGCFSGLNSAGIDLLMTPGGKLMVIEVNGQGDLIYQDIFAENSIYKSQVIGEELRWRKNT
ncbi:MAG: STM4014 family protein [Cellulosilyticaceae bacterium]